MNPAGWAQIVLYLGVLVLLAWPLGLYMARIYQDGPCWLDFVLGPLERWMYRLCGTSPEKEMGWKAYSAALLVFNMAGLLAVYVLQRVQGLLLLNPDAMGTVSPDSSFNTAVSFVTNTNWQGYGGESTMSYLTQMAALTVQNFLSAATGMAVLVALVRGIARRSIATIGNFWVDMTRSVLYILLPLSLLFSMALVWQGVPQTLSPAIKSKFLNSPVDDKGQKIPEQVIAVGPVASQIAIKQLGTNGGGYFNANSAHPFENPTPLSGFLEMLAILLIPAALCITFGRLVKDLRQGWALLVVMMIIFVPLLIVVAQAEGAGNPALSALGVAPGGNMEGKEVRFGIANSAVWSAATTAASNGSVNAMHDSFTPLGGLIPMWLMQLGEVIFGGVGSGLYGMLHFVIVAVFVAGLMVGRTPEYLGKKIEAFEIKMASIVVLAPCFVVLVGTAVAVATAAGRAGVANPGPHGFSEILYAFSSAGNNNGSAFAGLNANTPFYNLMLGFAMFIARYWVIVPALAMAGSLARKKIVPPGAGTLPTHTPLFVGLLVGVVLLVGALTFLPALALGPIVEHLQLPR